MLRILGIAVSLSLAIFSKTAPVRAQTVTSKNANQGDYIVDSVRPGADDWGAE